ncbi:outer membrane lipoprotein chaperone LolA [Marinibactrum halimedae]|uniref:Outer-membrane lipoprotein carrier protein n=1 Tax=Marinibactrum halimedae TaxID=1444977 RepID=A0AA37T5P8_9GAMM|nr:outer membrane lipoprotein chaperone LolA [Marinibactrum halimedae]MCD9460419.1 outer membrane lipoprotein chaperone LolA [Marinibactrum halimedae]GLS27450.1 hypothetical protein GCM10007877_31690 [Marinibactrum halimedae]
MNIFFPGERRQVLSSVRKIAVGVTGVLLMSSAIASSAMGGGTEPYETTVAQKTVTQKTVAQETTDQKTVAQQKEAQQKEVQQPANKKQDIHQAFTRELAKRLKSLQSVTGKFTQRLLSKEGELLQSSEGNFALQQPSQFRWHTLAPFEQVLMSDGDTLWLYDPDLEQVTVKKITPQNDQTPMRLISGDQKALTDNYLVSQLITMESFPVKRRYELVPTGASEYSAISVTFAGDQLIEMSALDASSNTTEFAFSDMNTAAKLNDEDFHFTIPKGTDVFHEDAP